MTNEVIKLKGYRYLSKLYSRTGAHILNPIKGLFSLGNELDFERNETEQILDYLENEGLVIIYIKEDKIAITNEGIIAIEEAESNPTFPSSHFPAIMNATVIRGTIKSSVPSHRSGSRKESTISFSKFEELKKSVKHIKNSIDKIEVSPEQKSKLMSELITVEIQISFPKPDTAVIKECVYSIRKILETASDSLLVRRLLSQLSFL